MNRLLFWFRSFGLCVALGVACLFLFLFVGVPHVYPKTYGISWSMDYATYLGIDSNAGLTAALTELGVRHVRIPTYWTHLERVAGVFDWSAIDRQLDIIETHQGTVTLVVGAKQPRWPECWFPDWAKALDATKRREAQLGYVRRTIERYKDRSVITRWQVENEPTFFGAFGDCALYDASLINEEIALITSVDLTHRRIVTTASGELSTWMFEPKGIDTGFSIYRVVLNPLFSRWSYWFFPSWFYGRKIALHTLLRGGRMYVSEFQMEPWVEHDLKTASFEDQFKTFDSKQLQDNLLFATRLPVPEIHFWGAEWWYWMKTQKGHPEFWDAMKQVF